MLKDSASTCMHIALTFLLRELDIDKKAVKYAKDNVHRNNLDDKITVRRNKTDKKILLNENMIKDTTIK